MDTEIYHELLNTNHLIGGLKDEQVLTELVSIRGYHKLLLEEVRLLRSCITFFAGIALIIFIIKSFFLKEVPK